MSVGPTHHRLADARSPASSAARVLDLRYRSVSAFLLAYSTGLSRGELFLETADALPVGARALLRLRPPGARPLQLHGTVVRTRPAAIGPGQPAGMAIALASSIEEHGAVIDELAFRHQRFRVLVASGETAPRTVIDRYLRSILACDVVPMTLADGEPTVPEQIDLAIVDLDSELRAGERVIETLRQRVSPTGVPIFALAQLERVRARAAAFGVDEVLTTPPLFSELRSAVLHALSRPLPVARGDGHTPSS